MYPAETREMKYQIIKKVMYSVHTGTYQLMTLTYVHGTYFFHRFGTQKPTFCIGLNLVHTSTYSRKKVWTKYILREKSTYQVQTGLCPFISVSYYSMVHTGMYRYVPGMYNWSRFQMVLQVREPDLEFKLGLCSLPAQAHNDTNTGRAWVIINVKDNASSTVLSSQESTRNRRQSCKLGLCSLPAQAHNDTNTGRAWVITNVKGQCQLSVLSSQESTRKKPKTILSGGKVQVLRLFSKQNPLVILLTSLVLVHWKRIKRL